MRAILKHYPVTCCTALLVGALIATMFLAPEARIFLWAHEATGPITWALVGYLLALALN